MEIWFTSHMIHSFVSLKTELEFSQTDLVTQWV